ncbi:hypothetical protein ACHAXR_009770, partial [Thalassiosira sp. AJA248-18]
HPHRRRRSITNTTALHDGNINALYTVAQSLNSRNAGDDDRITSVQLWHALADLDRPITSHQRWHLDIPMPRLISHWHFNTLYKQRRKIMVVVVDRTHRRHCSMQAVSFLELNNDAASSMAYIRGCANVENYNPTKYASSQQLTQTCTEAHEMISAQILLRDRESSSVSPPLGMEDAAEMFPYASIKEFPLLPNTKEFGIWNRGMEYLEMYSANNYNEGTDSIGEVSRGNKKKGQTYLLAAQQELEQLQTRSSEKMSELQNYLLDIILGRIQYLMNGNGD